MQFGYDDPRTHAWLVLDRVRTAAFARAIAAAVRPGDTVVDIGTGSGVLALFAAKAGAKKVYAIERTAAAELAKAHAAENGFSEVIEVVRAEASDALDPEHPRFIPGLRDVRVILGEILGHVAGDEHVHRLFRAAKKVARPDAVTVPVTYAMTFALAAVERIFSERTTFTKVNDIYGSVNPIYFSALWSKLAARPEVMLVQPAELLGPEVRTEAFALAEPLPRSFTAAFTADRDGRANAIVCSFDSRLHGDVHLSTAVSAAPTTWQQIVFPLDPPLDVAKGERFSLSVEPRLISDRSTYRWSARGVRHTSKGDGLGATLGGGKEDWLAQLGLRLKEPAAFGWSSRLDALAAMLAGGPTGHVATLAERLRAAHPTRYADEDDARQEVLRLLRLLEVL